MHATTMEVENASSSDSTAWWKQNRSNKILLVVALVALSVALGLTLSHRQEEKVDRDTTPLQIIGGSEAVPDRYSYMVSFHDSRGHFCSGSLIIHDIVLTAADCFWEGMEANAMAVVGRHDFSVDMGESIPIIGASFHPTYNQAAEGDNDIIIIFLETEFTASNVGLVKLNSNTSLPFVDQDLTTIGWGDTDVLACQIQGSPQLKHLNVKVISNEQCEASQGYLNVTYTNYTDAITENMVCVWANQEATCYGDS